MAEDLKAILTSNNVDADAALKNYMRFVELDTGLEKQSYHNDVADAIQRKVTGKGLVGKDKRYFDRKSPAQLERDARRFGHAITNHRDEANFAITSVIAEMLSTDKEKSPDIKAKIMRKALGMNSDAEFTAWLAEQSTIMKTK